MNSSKHCLLRRAVHAGTYVALLLSMPFVFHPALAKAQLADPNAEIALTPEGLTALAGGATTVTLQGQDIPLETAVEALLGTAKLSAEGVVSKSDEKRPVTVNWHQTPFWEAAKDLEAQTGLMWIYLSQDGASHAPQLIDKRTAGLMQGGLVGLSGANTPLVTVIASRISHRRESSATLGGLVLDTGAPTTETATLQLSAYFDPHIHVVSNSAKVRLTSVLEYKDIDFGENFVRGGTPLGLSAFVVSLGDQTNRPTVPLIQGVISANIITKSEVWEVPNITVTKTATREANGTTYTLEDVGLDGDTIILHISTRTNAQDTLLRVLSNPPRILDGQGKEVLSKKGGNLFSVSDGMKNSYKGELFYSLRVPSADFPEGEVRPGPFKLVWDIPTEVKTLKVPFEFRDVPLP